MTATVKTIHSQLLALGIDRKLRFVAWGPNTLKVFRGLNGVLIRYNQGTDLYDIDEYQECDVWPLAEGVYADSLLQVINRVFARRRA